MASRTSRGWIVGIVVGALLALGPVFGLLGTVIGLILSFDRASTGDPAQKSSLLASGISHSMWATAVGLAMFPIGAGLLACSIYMVAKSRRPADPA